MTLADTVPVTRSILIVEDEAMIALMLEEYLDMLGHHVSGVAASIAEAEALIERGGIDLAILDCHLGGEEVWPVADRLMADGVDVILSSGGSIAALPPRYAACPMLQKPYTIGALDELLGSVS
ncbi:MAG: response regulator [Sphingobium sp.]|nr:response regulator [Sphingobium sp.]MBP6112937.1 response regulator [Sphingobium sp.]MBP8669772.1 response regulator [Sphingobium sp.]MBP9156468.1 response regulator [Sphingobium sp.]MCC6481292.1 response regulator [Sphingomonadaceae bacterium]